MLHERFLKITLTLIRKQAIVSTWKSLIRKSDTEKVAYNYDFNMWT